MHLVYLNMQTIRVIVAVVSQDTKAQLLRNRMGDIEVGRMINCDAKNSCRIPLKNSYRGVMSDINVSGQIGGMASGKHARSIRWDDSEPLPRVFGLARAL
jgi:hypothetical protein